MREAARADADADGRLAGDELRAFVGGITGGAFGATDDAIGVVLLLFAVEHRDALSLPEAIGMHGFFAGLRFMAHERHSPPDYVDALAPNVVVIERRPVVSRREVPLTPERLRDVERAWRQRVGR